jgi:hypothetical protein
MDLLGGIMLAHFFLDIISFTFAKSPQRLKCTLANMLHTSTLSSNSITPNNDESKSSSSFSSKSVEKRDLAAYRINEYVTNPEHAHVQHRHASSQQAIRTHTNTMGSYLAAFDDSMNQGGD